MGMPPGPIFPLAIMPSKPRYTQVVKILHSELWGSVTTSLGEETISRQIYRTSPILAVNTSSPIMQLQTFKSAESAPIRIKAFAPRGELIPPAFMF